MGDLMKSRNRKLPGKKIDPSYWKFAEKCNAVMRK